MSDFGGGRVYADMEQWTGIRQRVLVAGASKRSVLRETGIHHETLEKMLTWSRPPHIAPSRHGTDHRPAA